MNAIGYLKNPAKIFFILKKCCLLECVPDVVYLKLMYKAHMGTKLDLDNPKTFNEKLQWLKLYDRNPEYTRMVDKYEAKGYVKEKLGGDSEKHIIPTLGVWEHFDDIDFDSLPEQFVLKTTHDSGTVVICKDKNRLDKDDAKQKIEKSLQHNFYSYGREWPYKNVHPRIIVEKYIELSSPDCAEYKLFCYNGKVNWVMVCMGKAHSDSERTNDGFDREFNHLPVRFIAPNANFTIEKPKEWEQLIEFAERLSKGITQLRVDTYLVNGNIYFGELTFFHDSGLCPITPAEWDLKLGKGLELPIQKGKERC